MTIGGCGPTERRESEKRIRSETDRNGHESKKDIDHGPTLDLVDIGFPETIALNALRTMATVFLLWSHGSVFCAAERMITPNSSMEAALRRSSLDTGGGIGLLVERKKCWLRFAFVAECTGMFEMGPALDW